MAKYKSEHLRHIEDFHQKKLKAAASGDLKFRPIPTKPDEMTWRDFLIMLLHIGSELEHGLMVQYLYAAYSLGSEGVPPEDQVKVREWQDAILTVAREEMGHLLTVQNLLCLVGGPVTFQREDFPWDTPFYPFPFRFEPLSKASLAAYLFAEMPDNFVYLEKYFADSTGGISAKQFVQHDIPYIEKIVKRWVKDRDARPVGAVYHLILAILSDPKLIADSDLRSETYPLQASWDDWGRSYGPRPSPPSGQEPKFNNKKGNVIIERAATRTEALYALREVLGQGEAAELKPKKRPSKGDFPGPEGETSHFEHFARILQAFEKKGISEKWNPVRNVPVNPTTLTSAIDDRPRRPELQPTQITAKASVKWANLFNVRYRMLLTYLTHTFRLARVVSPDEPNTRGAVMAKIFGEMYNIKSIAGILVCLPLTDQARDARRAAPTFQMPYTLELPLDEIDCWRLHRDIVLSSMEICDSLLDPAKDLLKVAPPAADPYLRALRNHDRQALAWLDIVITGQREKANLR